MYEYERFRRELHTLLVGSSDDQDRNAVHSAGGKASIDSNIRHTVGTETLAIDSSDAHVDQSEPPTDSMDVSKTFTEHSVKSFPPLNEDIVLPR